MDSGASHHVTNDIQNLSLSSDYDGPDEVKIGDGSGLHITHVGTSKINSSSNTLHLRNVLCVPSIKSNLISVGKFCKTNKVSVEFFPQYFSLKDLNTREVVLQGQNKDHVYVLPTSSPPTVHNTIRAPIVDWHRRLGHPLDRILHNIIHIDSLPLSSSSHKLKSCVSCACNKSHRLLFSQSTLQSSSPLELLFSDVWGPSPVKL
ncbi:hypothetical protein AABB24_025788 [Solanum stoloniferum]|uniref:GAG-pre-integrase domain-containing protein n=1 Tax=Solanum stoloniferum TaxID=62892 RepID=A0ABD2SC55_9SOLN